MEQQQLNIRQNGEQKGLPLKAYSNKQLAQIYEVDVKTFRSWLVPFQAQIGQHIGHYYTIKQVSIIIENIGMPNTIIGD